MKKLFVVTMIVSFLFVISCASSGGGGSSASAGGDAGEVVAGNWTWSVEEQGGGDTSTCTMVVAEEEIDGETVTTYAFSGTVTNAIQYGLAAWIMTPDAETLELLKEAKAISFKILGDGKRYVVEMPMETVKDYGFHARNITTEDGVVVEINLPIRSFTQPGWASNMRFNPALVSNVFVKTRNASDGGLGDFSVKMWDLKLHM